MKQFVLEIFHSGEKKFLAKIIDKPHKKVQNILNFSDKLDEALLLKPNKAVKIGLALMELKGLSKKRRLYDGFRVLPIAEHRQRQAIIDKATKKIEALEENKDGEETSRALERDRGQVRTAQETRSSRSTRR